MRTSRLAARLCAKLKASLEGGKVRVAEGEGVLLDAFNALSRARSHGPHGPNPISWEALAAWSHLTRTPIEPHHAEILMALDEVWLTHVYRKDKQAPEGIKALPPMSKHPINAALLDAMLG